MTLDIVLRTSVAVLIVAIYFLLVLLAIGFVSVIGFAFVVVGVAGFLWDGVRSIAGFGK